MGLEEAGHMITDVGECCSYRELQIAVLLQVTQPAINDNTFGLEVLSPEGHQTAVAGVDMRGGLGDEDYSALGYLVNLRMGNSEPLSVGGPEPI